MIIVCQLKCLLKNYLETLIVGFGQADVLGLSVCKFTYYRSRYFLSILNLLACICDAQILKKIGFMTVSKYIDFKETF